MSEVIFGREWEQVNGSMMRLKSFGGWEIMIYTTIIIGDKQVVQSLHGYTKIDPDHQWVLTPK